MSAEQPTLQSQEPQQQQQPQQQLPQQRQPGGELESPPPDTPHFLAQRRAQQRAPQFQTPLVRPPPGGLRQSPEDLTRQIGFRALAEAVTHSAANLHPNDPLAEPFPFLSPFAWPSMVFFQWAAIG